MSDKEIHILLFSSLFPHEAEPTLGVFVANRLEQLLNHEAIKATVIAPVPWFPFRSTIFGSYGRAARAPFRESRKGVEVFHPRYLVIPKIGMLLTPLFLYWSARKTVKKLNLRGYNFDLIDAHYLYPDGVAAGKLASKLGIPCVMTARGSDVTQIGQIKKPQNMIKAAVAGADHVITVSNNLKRDLMAMGCDGGSITTLRNGVDLEKFQHVEPAKLSGFDDGRPVMLFAGWLIPRKRVDLVLEVTRLIPELTTIIVGDGPLKSVLKRKATELDVEDRILFLGQKKPEAMPSYFSAADVLLLPSDREGWANVLLESMACGTPVVSRAIGGAPDLITDSVAGQVVDSDDPEAIAEAVAIVLRSKLTRQDVRHFAEKFDWKETSRGQRAIFEGILSDRRPPFEEGVREETRSCS
jgi:teichuronic acid biosynthesis glycosyltransferase TuaC